MAAGRSVSDRPAGSGDGQSSPLPNAFHFSGASSSVPKGLDVTTLAVVEQVLDEVWASIAPDLDVHGGGTDVVRMRLANIVLNLAKDGQLSALQITRTAARLMRETIEPAGD
jgi:hypothetical protein